MAMIFDRFPNNGAAVLFAAAVSNEHELDVAVFHSVGAAQDADPIPTELYPPIVHIERSTNAELEHRIEELVESFGGRFAGT